MTDTLRSLLAAATPPPWESTTQGHANQRDAAGAAFQAVMAVRVADNPEIEFSDMTWVVSPDGTKNVCLTGNGPKQTANAALIVYLANHAEALADLWEAAKAAHGPGELACDDGRMHRALAKLEVTR